MFDCHYDLLTYILMKKNEVELIKEHCRKVYRKDNITGGIFNLFYMSPAEMRAELGIEEDQINLIENLKEVKQFIESNQLISSDIKYIFGIEGLDYLKNIEDLDILYSLGLRSTNPVWSNENKFGGGVKSDRNIGLTKLGKRLIEKLVQKGIAIDLSHANETTFWDIIYLCKKLKKRGENPIVFASHSNSKAICNVPRNLTDEQILAIKELEGVVGVVSIKKFCIDTEEICDTKIDFEQKYIDHINYIRDLLGGVDNISVATDDMRYYYIEPEYYQNLNVYMQYEVKEKLEKALINNDYSKKEIEQILFRNFEEKILQLLDKKTFRKSTHKSINYDIIIEHKEDVYEKENKNYFNSINHNNSFSNSNCSYNICFKLATDK